MPPRIFVFIRTGPSLTTSSALYECVVMTIEAYDVKHELVHSSEQRRNIQCAS